MDPSAKERVGEVLDSGFIGEGVQVKELEEALKKFFNVDYLATSNSATSAEHLALELFKRYDQPHRDEVLTTALTCTATNWTILHAGLKPVWVDINPKNLNMDMDDLERKVTPKTKVIYLTHWSGYPCDIDRAKQIAQKAYDQWGFRPFILADGAHSFGSRYKGRLIGSHGGVVTTFSMQAIKHVTSGDGGFMTAPGWDNFYKDFKLGRWYGIDREDTARTDFRCENDVKFAGYKYHMNNISAAIGLANLPNAAWITSKHRENAAYYDKELSNIKGIQLLERHPDYDSASWIYSLLVERRSDFMEAMKSQGIVTSQVHERNDKHTCVKEYKAFLPNLDATIPKLVHIPVGWWVTAADREYIRNCIGAGW